MPYGFDEIEGGYGGNDNIDDAPNLDGQDGACPPQIVNYRIYPEANFNLVFGAPPVSVIT